MERMVYSSRLPTQLLRIPAATVALPVILLLTSLLTFLAAKRFVFYMAGQSEAHGFALLVFSIAAAIPFAGLKHQDIPRLLRIMVRGIGAVVLVQVLFDSFAPVPPAPNVLFGDAGAHALFFRWGALLAVLAGIASLWRPAFLMPLFVWYVAFRLLIGPRTGIWVTDTDFLAMLDGGMLAGFGVLIILTVTNETVLQRLPFLRSLLGDVPAPALRLKAANLVWAMVVGAHLSNYFCSGVAKLMAGGTEPWTWLLENPTQTAIVIGLERGNNPLALVPGLLQGVWDAISENRVAFNIFVLGAQLATPFVILRVRWLAAAAVLFDLFHIGVYLTLGALFHFWIAVNLIVSASVWRMRDAEISSMMKLVCVLTVLGGSQLFYTNWLGWLDGAKLASPQFYAVTRDGREVWMTPTYFGIYSYTIAQAVTYVPENHFSARIGGNNLNRADWHDSTHCGPRTVPAQNFGSELAAMERLVHETHAFMERHPAIKAHNLFYLYPHHMQPNPWVFREFNRLQLEDIVGYKYVVTSVCLNLEGGALQRDVRKREEFRFNVR